MFTNLYLPTSRTLTLRFVYRLVPRIPNFRFILRRLKAVPSLSSLDSVQSFTWQMIWSGQSGGLVTDWLQVKMPLPRGALGLKFEISQAEVAVDNVFLTPSIWIPYAQLAPCLSPSQCTCVLHVSVGEVRCWGSNLHGELGQGNTDTIGNDPSEMGDALPPVDLGTGRKAKQISAGGGHTCALLDDDTIKCWGDNQYGQWSSTTIGLIGDGPNEMGDALPVVDLGTGRTAKQVSAGGYHTCAVLDDDSIRCWGWNGWGQAGPNVGSAVDLGTNRTAKEVLTGFGHTCALLDNDSVKCWGKGTLGRLGQGTTSDIGTSPDDMGENLPPVSLGVGRAVKQLSLGALHTCALLDDDSIKCWGYNNDGQLGQGNPSNIGDDPGEMGDALAPVDLGTGRKAKQISAGGEHTCALLDDDTIKCWGDNFEGQCGHTTIGRIGDGPNEMGDALPVVDLGTGRIAKHVSAGPWHSCAVLDDDSIRCWGWNAWGQLGQGHVDDIGDDAGEMGDALTGIEFGAVGQKIDTALRVVNGTSMHGRLQVRHRDMWLDVCDDNWNDLNAQVACRQLGLAGGTSLIVQNGTGEFGMDEVVCRGGEVDLGHCHFRGWGVHDCSPDEAAGVVCHVDAWTIMANPNISARRSHSTVWLGDGMLTFAGHAASLFQYYNDLWHYSDGSWTAVDVDGPSPRGGHTAVWDLGSRTMLVFGGSQYTTYYDQLWLYKESNNTWSLSSAPTKPRARAFHSAVWDSENQIMFLFGGESGLALDDLWSYRLASDQWTEMSPSSQKPLGRSRHAAVWMEATQAMLMFGGWAVTALNDLWHYALWSNTWTQLLSSNPPSRAGHSACWEPLTWSMLTFGGVGSSSESLNYTAELWNYSFLTNTWTPMAPIGPYPSPSAREDHATVWDPDSQFLYLLGGFDSTYKDDFWRYKSWDLQELPVKECHAGQKCSLNFQDQQLSGSQAAAWLRVVGPSTLSDVEMSAMYFFTLNGYNFSLDNITDVDNSTIGGAGEALMFAEPGLYRIQRCAVDFGCEASAAVDWLAFGFLLVVGPFSGQTFVCDLGSHCLITGLQGAQISQNDSLLALQQCGTSIQTSTFEARPVMASVDASGFAFDFGSLQLDGLAPEQVHLCWCPRCPQSTCRASEDFRALAMLLYVVCPPGKAVKCQVFQKRRHTSTDSTVELRNATRTTVERAIKWKLISLVVHDSLVNSSCLGRLLFEQGTFFVKHLRESVWHLGVQDPSATVILLANLSI